MTDGRKQGGDTSFGAAYTVETLTFECLYRDCAQALHRFVLRSVRDPRDAEDICQEVWTRAYQQLPTIRDPGAARSWLYRIARHAVIDAARHRARRLQPDTLVVEPVAAPAEEPANVAIASEQGAIAWQALAALQPRQRIALYLKEVEERRYREIAEQMDCSESAVETLLFRARRRFAERYAGLAESRSGRCKQAERIMALLLDGEGDSLERRAVQAHVDECSACRTTLVAAREHRAARAALPLVAIPFSAPLSAGGPAALVSTALEAARTLGAKLAAVLGGKAVVVAGTGAVTVTIAAASLTLVPLVDRAEHALAIVVSTAATVTPREVAAEIASPEGTAGLDVSTQSNRAPPGAADLDAPAGAVRPAIAGIAKRPHLPKLIDLPSAVAATEALIVSPIKDIATNVAAGAPGLSDVSPAVAEEATDVLEVVTEVLLDSVDGQPLASIDELPPTEEVLFTNEVLSANEVLSSDEVPSEAGEPSFDTAGLAPSTSDTSAAASTVGDLVPSSGSLSEALDGVGLSQ